MKQMLTCLEGIHQSQSGALLVLLTEKFLHTHHLTLARQCDMLACRRAEHLLADDADAARQQLSYDDVSKALRDVSGRGVAKRHQRLVTLLEKLRAHLYGDRSEQQQKQGGDVNAGVTSCDLGIITTATARAMRLDQAWGLHLL